MATLLALNPSEIFKEETKDIRPPVIQVNVPPTPVEQVAKEQNIEMNNALLASLAPDSFAPQDYGAGVSFSGAGGPGVGGSGGFGTDMSQLVQERAEMNRPPGVMLKGQLEYPLEARQKNISGYVILKILISENGVVQNVEVEESQPRGIFDRAAIQSVKSWRFEPAMIKGKFAAAWTSQKIRFELN
ncbi:MAG: TonB family protein [Bdellovibrionaceae bacterium]|nr:TonB family protein [Pseudobdellovibrionaceae bacterium]